MAILPRRTEFTPPPSSLAQHAIPALSIVLASLLSILPYIATAPVLPPFGFLMLLAWRLLRNDLWPVWAAWPFGLFDDLLTGAPLGSGAALWTITFIAIDLIDRRFVWRDHWQDWRIAIAATGVYLVTALGIANLTGGATPAWLIVPQILIAALTFPLVSRIAAMLDRWRFGR